jgi:hypothetical protein
VLHLLAYASDNLVARRREALIPGLHVPQQELIKGFNPPNQPLGVTCQCENSWCVEALESGQLPFASRGPLSAVMVMFRSLAVLAHLTHPTSTVPLAAESSTPQVARLSCEASQKYSDCVIHALCCLPRQRGGACWRRLCCLLLTNMAGFLASLQVASSAAVRVHRQLYDQFFFRCSGKEALAGASSLQGPSLKGASLTCVLPCCSSNSNGNP